MTGFSPETGRRPDGAAFFIAAVLTALGVLLLWQGYSIPDKGGYAGIGSGGMPKAVGWGLLGLGLWHVVAGFRSANPSRPRQQPVPIFWIVGGLALQLILLKPLGFTIASALLFACTAAAFGKRNLALTLPVGLVFAFAVYAVFDQLLQLNLPAGFPETLIFGG